MNPTLQAEPRRHRRRARSGSSTSAERLVQQRGFNGFSYADIAAELGITKASLHYHFASKADLGRGADRPLHRALRAARSRRSTPSAGRAGEARTPTPASTPTVLSERAHVPVRHARRRVQTLPEPMRDAVIALLRANEAWLARVLEAGRGDGTLRFTGYARGGRAERSSARSRARCSSRAPTAASSGFETTARRLLAGLAGND